MRFPNPIPPKKWLIGIAAATLFACGENSREVVTPEEECFHTQVVQQLTHAEGQVEKVADFYVIETEEQRYSACNLPEELMAAGTRVRFDANVYQIPPNFRLVGTPIKITRIY